VYTIAQNVSLITYDHKKRVRVDMARSEI